MTAKILQVALWGVLTFYSAQEGDLLYCGGAYEQSGRWLALPVEAYQSGLAACGDMFAVWSEGMILYLPARDAGGFGPYCVMDGGECVDIVADLPEHSFPWQGLSRAGYVVNSQPYRGWLGQER